MSENVHYTGKAKELVIPEGMNEFQFARKLLEMEEDINIEEELEIYEDEIECLLDLLEGKFFYHSKTKKFYEITKVTEDPYSDTISADIDSEGNISYELRYYNGGAGFQECLEEALTKLSVRKES